MTESDRKNPKKKSLFPLVLVLLAIGAVTYAIWRTETSPRTDDAYAFADTVSIVPEVSGRIIEMKVRDNQLVKPGDVLFQIDPRPFEAALNVSKNQLLVLDKQIELTQRSVNAQALNARSVNANVEAARANAQQAADSLKRIEPLLGQGFASAEEVDRARTAQKASQAQLQAALLQGQTAVAGIQGVDAIIAQKSVIEAQMEAESLRLEYATVTAPFMGRVTSLDTKVGQYVSPAKAVFTLIDAEEWYVMANFREGDLKDVRPGTRATVYLLSDTKRTYEAEVDSIAWGVNPSEGNSLLGGLPRVSKSINWVHVSQRFPVKVKVLEPDPELFRLGASATVILHKNSAR
ncbi:multidrug transporter subunit MdtN [Comamonas odontotermitis]|uniref:multidrug transporter subunit MdtN n=1 Tax=Comamonas odontotermitis TaxID=379895 RepID=UPI003751B77E